jgi:hypothetical protein
MTELQPGIRLDVGSGAASRPGWFSIDNRAHPAVHLVWDLECIPWPLEDCTVVQAFAGHVVARINPARWGFIAWMDELHRLLVPAGELMIVSYYGTNQRYQGDPAACNPVTESTFYHFDPAHKSGLWHVYQPQPWLIRDLRWSVDGNIECWLVKR